MIVSSAKNPTVKNLRKLFSSAKFRRQEGLYVAEGAHLAYSMRVAGQEPRKAIVAESASQNAEILELLEYYQRREIEIITMSDSLFESISSLQARVGIFIVFTAKTSQTPPKIGQDCILLENIQDPGNIGTILRTAAAAGVSQAFLSPGCASAWSTKALRAGMGAQFEMQIFEEVDLVKLNKKSNLQIIATNLNQQAKSLYDYDLTAKTAWIFGNEGQGISSELLATTSNHAFIPQIDSAVESLNVSAAAAVCLFEQRRQRL